MGVIDDYKVIFFAILLPSFFIGWKVGRGKWLGQIVKQLIEVGMLAVVSHSKKQLLSAFR